MAVVNVWFPFDKRRILWTSCMILLVVDPSALHSMMYITGGPVSNEDAFINCYFTSRAPEHITAIQISPDGSDPSYNDSYFVLNDKLVVYQGSNYHGRLSLDYYKWGDNTSIMFTMSLKMKISKLQCRDAGIYQCVFYYSPSNYTRLSEHLTVAARPRSPSILVDARAKVHIRGIMYMPHGHLEAKCLANVGGPGRGYIEWMLHHDCVPEYIKPDDPRIQPMETVPLLPEDEICSERVSQTFVMETATKDKKLRISCFVRNKDIPARQGITNCSNTSLDLCVKADTIFFDYKDMVQSQQSVAENVLPFKWSHIFFPLSLGLLIGLVVNIAYSISKQCRKPATQAQTEQGKASSG